MVYQLMHDQGHLQVSVCELCIGAPSVARVVPPAVAMGHQEHQGVHLVHKVNPNYTRKCTSLVNVVSCPGNWP